MRLLRPLPTAADASRGPSSGVHPATRREGTVMLVEPDPDAREAMAAALSARFFVLEAGDAQSAAELLGQHPPPQALVVSAALPGIDGASFVHKMRGFPELAKVPVVFLTSAKDARELARAIGAGARACLEKPVNAQELAARLVRLVAAPR